MANALDLPIQHKRDSLFGTLSSKQAFWVFIAVIAACVFLTFATNSFATPNNLFNVTRNFTFVAVIALGTTIVIITGGIDLSVGSVLCLCSMILAEVMHAGYSIEVGIAASLAVALLVGAFNGILIAYLGIPPFVVTLGMLSIARSLAMVASNNTVVFQFGPDHDKLLYLGGGAFLFGISNPVVYTVLLALITGFVLRWTRFGRYVYAIGGNEKAATLTGVPVRRIKVAVYMISALTAGIAGVIETGWLGAGDDQSRGGHGVAGHRCGRHRWGEFGRWHRYGLRRADRLGVDRGDPQQPGVVGDQRILAGRFRRRLHHHRGVVRSHPQFRAIGVGGDCRARAMPIIFAASDCQVCNLVRSAQRSRHRDIGRMLFV